jgi:hypothetical protein
MCTNTVGGHKKKVQKVVHVFIQTHVISFKISLLQFYTYRLTGNMYLYIIQVNKIMTNQTRFHKVKNKKCFKHSAVSVELLIYSYILFASQSKRVSFLPDIHIYS